MKTTLALRPRSDDGSTLLIVMGTVVVLGIALASVMGLTMQEHRILARTAAWNAALPAAEAGIEEAMSHLRQINGGNRAVNGWAQSGSSFILARNLSQSQFSVAISSANPPTITSIGYVWSPSAKKNISRTVQVTTKSQGIFMKAVVTRDQIKMSGQTLIDSFDSSNPLYSTNGLYTASKRKDNGDVGANRNAAGSIDFSGSNVKIYGRVSTGPDGTVNVAGGAIGSTSFVDGGGSGIQTNRYTKDLNVSFPDVVAPFTNGSAPISSVVGGVTYKYVLAGGIDYKLSTLTLTGNDKVLVTGKTRLLVDNDIKFGSSTFIQIATNASIEIYLKAGAIDIGGQSVANANGKAADLALYGLPAVTSMKISGGGSFLGTVYAPNATLTLSGGGGSDLDFTGAAVVNKMDASGQYRFHYDEALGPSSAKDLVITSWKEL